MPAMMVWPVSSFVRTRKVGILLGEALQRLGQLVLVGLGLGLDGDVDDGLGEDDRLEQHGVVGIAQRVAGGRLLEADGGGDGARADLLQVLAVVRVHLEQPADALLAAGRRVEHVGARVDLARVDAEVGQLADERVAHDLEGERRERLVEVGRPRPTPRRCADRSRRRAATSIGEGR